MGPFQESPIPNRNGNRGEQRSSSRRKKVCCISAFQKLFIGDVLVGSSIIDFIKFQDFFRHNDDEEKEDDEEEDKAAGAHARKPKAATN